MLVLVVGERSSAKIKEREVSLAAESCSNNSFSVQKSSWSLLISDEREEEPSGPPESHRLEVVGTESFQLY